MRSKPLKTLNLILSLSKDEAQIQAFSTLARRGCGLYCHQRKNLRPAIIPATVTRLMAAVYQIAPNSGESSWQ